MLITLKRDAKNKEIPRVSMNIAKKKELVVSLTEKEVNKLTDWSNKFCNRFTDWYYLRNCLGL